MHMYTFLQHTNILLLSKFLYRWCLGIKERPTGCNWSNLCMLPLQIMCLLQCKYVFCNTRWQDRNAPILNNCMHFIQYYIFVYCQNKEIYNARLPHACKFSRKNAMQNQFQYLLVRSDPVSSSTSFKKTNSSGC